MKLIYIVMLFFVVSFVCMNNSDLSAAAVEDDKWSFEFIDLTVSEILNEINNVSGVEIGIKGEIEERTITKSYQDYTIDNVLMDIFSSENHAVLFQYDDAELSAVNIWVLPEGEDRVMHTDIFKNDPSLSLPAIESNRIQRYEYRSRGSRIVTVKSVTKASNNLKTTKNNMHSSVSFINKDSSATENIAEANSSNSGISEAVDIVPLAEIVATLGLEPPPMPPGLSFQ